MKKRIMLGALIMAVAFTLTGCGRKAPDNWYEEIVNYYKDGVADNWTHVDSSFNIPDDYKKEKMGYLLKDLDGDGTNELLIGIVDDSSETKFTDVFIYHKDFGPTRSFSTGDGYYMYLCDSNIIREDYWYGSETKTQYMKYDPESNGFPVIDSGSLPRKHELTPF